MGFCGYFQTRFSISKLSHNDFFNVLVSGCVLIFQRVRQGLGNFAYQIMARYCPGPVFSWQNEYLVVAATHLLQTGTNNNSLSKGLGETHTKVMAVAGPLSVLVIIVLLPTK